MTHIKNTSTVNYSAQQMYDLVNDIEAYPEFLPWCKSAHIEKSDAHSMTASLEISKGPINSTFTTKNSLDPGKKITLDLVAGPFKTLKGIWEFTSFESEQSCCVTFQVEFSFSNLPMRLLLQPVMQLIAENMLNAFITRAEKTYGKN
jgi:ribosome-associated toxin RatA of RatAB toxin-antitoxin module